MRKFLIPIINLVNIILVSITFGLGSKTAVLEKVSGEVAKGTYYQLVWNAADHANVLGIIGFFLFVFAVAFMLALFIPFRCRKYLSLIVGAMFIGAGVLFLLTPGACDVKIIKPELTGALIAMAVLVFVAGALTLGMAAIELSAKKEAK